MAKINTAENAPIDDATYEVVLAQEALVLDAQMAIQRVLNEKKVSQRQLAALLGVGESYISQMMGDTARNLTLKTIAKVMHALGESALVTTEAFAKGFIEPVRPYNADAEFGPWGEIVSLTSGSSASSLDWCSDDWAANENPSSETALIEAA